MQQIAAESNLEEARLRLIAVTLAGINAAPSASTIVASAHEGLTGLIGTAQFDLQVLAPGEPVTVETVAAGNIYASQSAGDLTDSHRVILRLDAALDQSTAKTVVSLLRYTATALDQHQCRQFKLAEEALTQRLAALDTGEAISQHAVEWFIGHFRAQDCTIRETLPGENRVTDAVPDHSHTHMVLEARIRVASRPDTILTLTREDRPWTAVERALVAELATVLERHLNRAAQQQRAAIQSRLLPALQSLTAEASTATTFEELCRTIHRVASELLPHEIFLVGLQPPYGAPRTLYYADNGYRLPQQPASDTIKDAMRVPHPTIVHDALHSSNSTDTQALHEPVPIRSSVSAPLRAEGEPIGVLIAQSREPNAFQWEHAELLAQIAQGTAGAFERLVLLEQISRKTERDAALRSVAERVSGTLNADVILDLASDVIFDTVGCETAIVAIINRSAARVDGRSFRSRRHQPTVPPVGLTLDADSVLLAAIDSMEQRVVPVATVRELSMSRDQDWTTPGTLVATPITIDAERAGMILLTRSEEENFSDADLSLQRQIATILSTALQNAIAHEDRLRHTRDLTELQRLGASIASQLDLKASLKEIMESASKLVNADGSAIGVIDGEDLTTVGRSGIVEDVLPNRLRMDGPIIQMVLESSRPVSIDDLAELDLSHLTPPLTPDIVRGMMAIPLNDADGTPVGILGVFTANARVWTKRERALLVTLAASAALAIQNARHFERTRDLLWASVESLTSAMGAKDPHTQNHSREVARISMHIAGELGLDAETTAYVELAGLLHDVGKIGIPDSVIARPGPLAPSEWAAMQLHPVIGEQILSGNPILEPLLPMVRHHHERWDGHGYPDRLQGDAIPLGSAIIAVAEAVETITSDRPYQEARSWRQALEEIQAGRGRQFSPEVVDAFLLAVGKGHFPELEIRDTGWLESIEERSDRRHPPLDVRALKVFEAVARDIRAGGDVDTFLTSVITTLKDVFGVPYIALYVRDEHDQRLSLSLAIPDAPNARKFDHYIGQGGGIVGWVAKHGILQNIPDVTRDDRYFDGGYKGQVLSELCVPLIADGEVIGVINMESDKPAAFSDVDERLMISTADHLANAIHVVQLHERLRRLSTTDALTGLNNHRAFFEQVETAVCRAIRNGSELTIAILDVDNLKLINDSYGHLAGDAALRAVAATLRRLGRDDDILCRYGGDEFAIIFPDTSAAAAWELLERISAELEAGEFDLDGLPLPLPRASWGLATAPEDGDRAFELISVADERMYLAKQRSRP